MDTRCHAASSSNPVAAMPGPPLAGKLTGMAFRVPTLDVSVVDLTVNLNVRLPVCLPAGVAWLSV